MESLIPQPIEKARLASYPTWDRLAADLDKAADYIDEHGWTQGEFRGTDGAVCAYEALEVIADRFQPTRRALKAHLRIPSLINWNDAQEQTQEGVIAGLRGTAQALRDRFGVKS